MDEKKFWTVSGNLKFRIEVQALDKESALDHVYDMDNSKLFFDSELEIDEDSLEVEESEAFSEI